MGMVDEYAALVIEVMEFLMKYHNGLRNTGLDVKASPIAPG